MEDLILDQVRKTARPCVNAGFKHRFKNRSRELGDDPVLMGAAAGR